MSSAKFMDFVLIFFLPNTKKETHVRQSILSYVKSFTVDSEIFRKYKVIVKERSVDIDSDNFAIYFNSAIEFNIGAVTDKEDQISDLNKVLNEVCRKLNEKKEWIEAKSKIRVLSTLESEIGTEFDLVGKILPTDSCKLPPSLADFSPIRLDVKNETDNISRILSIIKGRKRNKITTSIVYTDKESLPLEAAKKAYEDHIEVRDKLLSSLVK